MSRYIDAEYCEDFFDRWESRVKNAEPVTIDVVQNTRTLLREAPSIDMVFCKECKHRPIKEDADDEDFGFNIIAPEGSSLCPCLVEDGWYSWMPKDNFFCGYGEREDEQ